MTARKLEVNAVHPLVETSNSTKMNSDTKMRHGNMESRLTRLSSRLTSKKVLNVPIVGIGFRSATTDKAPLPADFQASHLFLVAHSGAGVL